MAVDADDITQISEKMGFGSDWLPVGEDYPKANGNYTIGATESADSPYT